MSKEEFFGYFDEDKFEVVKMLCATQSLVALGRMLKNGLNPTELQKFNLTSPQERRQMQLYARESMIDMMRELDDGAAENALAQLEREKAKRDELY